MKSEDCLKIAAFVSNDPDWDKQEREKMNDAKEIEIFWFDFIMRGYQDWLGSLSISIKLDN